MTIIKERKSFICEVSKSRKLDEELFRISNESTIFSHVWLQGIIFKINKEDDYIIIDDYTDIAIIENCSRMPNIWSDLKEGFYVMVIGQLIDDCNYKKEKRVKTVKIQMLDNAILEISWPLEVITANG